MLAPWKESYDKSKQCIKKQRHHSANKGLYSQNYGFSVSGVQMWGWALKSWWLQTVVLVKTLESPLNSKEIKPVNPKEINPEYSLEGLLFKLKLQCFGYLMQWADSLEKTLMLGKIEGRRRRGDRGWDCCMASTQWSWVLANSGRQWRRGKPGMLQSMRSRNNHSKDNTKSYYRSGPVIRDLPKLHHYLCKLSQFRIIKLRVRDSPRAKHHQRSRPISPPPGERATPQDPLT